MFDLSLEMVDDGRNGVFQFLSRPLDSRWYPAMNDLLEDPQGEFFIDDNQYANLALYMVNCIVPANLEYVPPAGYLDLVINVTLQAYSNVSHYAQDLSKNPG